MQSDFFNEEDTAENVEYTDTLKCNTCGEVKTLDNFYFLEYKSGTIEYKRKCKDCNQRENAIISKLKALNPIDRSVHKCEICNTTLKDIDRGPKRFVLDHCHDTGKFRGWLCQSCNTGIGALGDDHKIVEKALEYLKKHVK
jgi:hypothetical protein